MIDYNELFDKRVILDLIDLEQDRPALRREIKKIAKNYKLETKNIWRIFIAYRSKKLGK